MCIHGKSMRRGGKSFIRFLKGFTKLLKALHGVFSHTQAEPDKSQGAKRWAGGLGRGSRRRSKLEVKVLGSTDNLDVLNVLCCKK